MTVPTIPIEHRVFLKQINVWFNSSSAQKQRIVITIALYTSCQTRSFQRGLFFYPKNMHTHTQLHLRDFHTTNNAFQSITLKIRNLTVRIFNTENNKDKLIEKTTLTSSMNHARKLQRHPHRHLMAVFNCEITKS
ncbi:hypothetical protein A1OW_04805 [Enterovibrio norvegicus]|nr:hypothetical protein A1OW_04805 [Enterovibrio norvegicus]PMH65657.1 hypothetical protein BCU62_12030 [Enterovibrio norvegicus]PMI32976.1 hypothetical protein BCU47_10525 [Enterovibrio norvegicus]PMI33940.1 hypothetical protein BCU46_21580 [Enterovibrio norvegicus]